MVKPRLVTVAPGTRHADGPMTVRSLVRKVGRRLPDVEVVESYVDLVEPSFSSAMAASTGPTVVVPLLLSTGYHVTHDLPASARMSPYPVTMARPLGPHPLLAAAGAMQLRAAGAARGDAVVLVVAGSTDPDALVEATVAGRLLRSRWGAPVRVAFLSGKGPGVADVFDGLRADGHRRIVASPHLLAPGYFASKARSLALANGAAAVGDLLGHHPLVAELVIRRYLGARRSSIGAGFASSLRRTSRVA